MLYYILKPLLLLGMNLYYRKIKVVNRQNLKTEGPRIIIANHPNTLLDAWLVGSVCRGKIYYMTKGTFFSSPFKKKLLMSLGMIPINRQVDKMTSGVSNEDSFELCYRVLEEGNTLVIFPEGNSFAEKLLRKLKSGTARIALEAERRNDGKLGLQIIPVGLIYLQPEKFRSSVLVNVGKAINPLPYLDSFKEDSLRSSRLLTEVFREKMTALLVDSETPENETIAEQVIELLSSNYVKDQNENLEQDVNFIRKVNNGINRLSKFHPEQLRIIEQLVYQLKWRSEQMKIRPDFLDRNFRAGMFMRQMFFSVIGLILGSPLFIIGFIHNIIPYKLTDKIMPKLTSDVEYYAPIAILLGLVLYPVTYGLFLFGLGYFIELTLMQKLIYYFSLPLFGLFAYSFYAYYKHIFFKWRYIVMIKDQKDLLKAMRAEKEKIKEILFAS